MNETPETERAWPTSFRRVSSIAESAPTRTIADWIASGELTAKKRYAEIWCEEEGHRGPTRIAVVTTTQLIVNYAVLPYPNLPASTQAPCLSCQPIWFWHIDRTRLRALLGQPSRKYPRFVAIRDVAFEPWLPENL
jgi:hypothetical protein